MPKIEYDPDSVFAVNSRSDPWSDSGSTAETNPDKYGETMMRFDPSLSRDVTVEFQRWRQRVVCTSERGPVSPVEMVDVTATVRSRAGGRAILVYSSNGTDWYVHLDFPIGEAGVDGSFASVGFAPMRDLSWSPGPSMAVSREAGLNTEEFRALVLGCVPGRLRGPMRDAGVPL